MSDLTDPLDPSRLATGRLSLRGLRMFVALEQSGSVAAAARHLGLSKSSVSQHITTLEQKVGARLFDRSRHPVTLTPAGQMLSLHAHRILAMLSQAETALAEVNLYSLPVLNFAIIDDLDGHHHPGAGGGVAVASAAKLHPHLLGALRSGHRAADGARG